MVGLFPQYKEQRITLFTAYLKANGSDNCNIPLVFTNRDEAWMITANNERQFDDCNHEEADTKILVHALREDTNVVVVARDTDVLILMVFAYALKNVAKEWYMKYAPDK